MTVVTVVNVEEAKRVAKDRGVDFEWLVGMIPADGHHGEREVLAVLSISHSKAGYNYWNGTHTTEDYFSVSVRNEMAEKRESGFSSRVVKLPSGVGIGRVPAGNRYSAKKLRDAEAAAVEMFNGLVEAGDDRVLRYFAPGGYTPDLAL